MVRDIKSEGLSWAECPVAKRAGLRRNPTQCGYGSHPLTAPACIKHVQLQQQQGKVRDTLFVGVGAGVGVGVGEGIGAVVVVADVYVHTATTVAAVFPGGVGIVVSRDTIFLVHAFG